MSNFCRTLIEPEMNKETEVADVIGLISGYPLFKNVDPDVFERSLNDLQIYTLKEGDILLTPEEVNTQIFVVIDGKFSVHTELHMESITTLRAGDCMGEMSLFEGEYPSAYVVAISRARVLGIHKEIIWQVIDGSNSFAQNLLHHILKRVSSGNQALAEMQEKLQAQEVSTFVDPLTGIYNRRWLNSMFNRALERARQSPNIQSNSFLMMIDIDNFKTYNDTLGHLAGDQCLRIVAALLRTNLRPTDLFARYGGEEFSVLLSGISEEACISTAERLRKAVSQEEIIDRRGSKLKSVTISIGIAKFQPDNSLEDLIDKADKCLYKAKESGRNRVFHEI